VNAPRRTTGPEILTLRRRALVAVAAAAALPRAAAIGDPGVIGRIGESGPAGAAAAGRVWPVAPGESLAAAVAQAGEGDTIELLSGVHRGQAAVILQRQLRLRGAGGPVWLQADGAHAEGKALLVVRNGDVQIQGIGFRGARVRDGNGAGIRFERGRLHVTDCEFAHNETGLLSGNDGLADLHIERCVFRDAPWVLPTHGLTHLLYVGRIARVRVEQCRFSGGRRGHLLKSRAAVSRVVGNRFGALGDGGSPSYELEFPNGGDAEVRDNWLLQSEHSPNRTMLAFGAEGDAGLARSHALVLVGNRFMNQGSRGAAVRLHADRLSTPVAVQARDNRFAGALDVSGPWADRTQGNQRMPLAQALAAAQAHPGP
jgi:hypothetical protein